MFELLNISSMGIEAGSLLMLGMIIGLLILGLPLAFITALVAGFFLLFWIGPQASSLISTRVYAFVTSYAFVSVPMFVLMAAILDGSNISRDLFAAMKSFSGNIRGSVAIQTIVLAVFLAAMSGIIGGETILLGMIALPQMLKMGYDKKLAIGVVVSGGALGTMVPPSIVLIIFGLTANVSISDLFTASFLPALMLAGFYIAYVLIRGYLNPSMVPESVQEYVPWSEKIKSLKKVILPLLVAASVLGSIYMGIASVTESSAIGVLGITLSVYLRKELTWKLMVDSAYKTLETCGTIIWIGIGATLLVGVFNLMGGIEFVKGVILAHGSGSPIYIIFLMMVILFFLGMFLDWVGIVLLTIPIFMPIVIALGYDPVWFGVLFALNMQIAFLSPPFGTGVFILKTVAPPDVSLGDIFKAVIPFIMLQALAIVVLIVFPEIALWWK